MLAVHPAVPSGMRTMCQVKQTVGNQDVPTHLTRVCRVGAAMGLQWVGWGGVGVLLRFRQTSLRGSAEAVTIASLRAARQASPQVQPAPPASPAEWAVPRKMMVSKLEELTIVT